MTSRHDLASNDSSKIELQEFVNCECEERMGHMLRLHGLTVPYGKSDVPIR